MNTDCLSPKQTIDELVQAADQKVSYSFRSRLLLSIMAGAFIALGAHGAVIAFETPIISAAVFPIGLMMIVLIGGELFTGNFLITFALLRKKISFRAYASSLTQVLFGNFIGAVFIAALLFYSGIYEKPVLSERVQMIARNKSTLPAIQLFCRGILCNILVVAGVWFAATAKSTGGKIIGCWFPIMLFILSSYEHIIANMFYLPLGIFLGAEISVFNFFRHLFWVGLGNYCGGGIIFPFVYHWVHNKS